jgi:hypothetical protein
MDPTSASPAAADDIAKHVPCSGVVEIVEIFALRLLEFDPLRI